MDGMSKQPEYGWQVVEVRPGKRDREVHVLPAHEADHAREAACWCGPRVEPATPDRCLYVVHNEKN